MDLDPDSEPDPAIFVIDLQDNNKKLILKKYVCLLLFEGTFTSFFNDKKSKRSHKTVAIKVFLTIFLKMEGSGSISLTKGYGSGSRRPKNIRIRIRIQIRNTGKYYLAHRLPNTRFYRVCRNYANFLYLILIRCNRQAAVHSALFNYTPLVIGGTDKK
jgi:hypothetical protein